MTYMYMYIMESVDLDITNIMCTIKTPSCSTSDFLSSPNLNATEENCVNIMCLCFVFSQNGGGHFAWIIGHSSSEEHTTEMAVRELL